MPRGMCVCVYVCVSLHAHVSLCTYTVFEGGWEGLCVYYVFCLVPIIKHWLCYCCKCMCSFPTRIASVVFCTKATLSTHKPLQAVEPNVEFGALLQDIYNEIIHNVQYQGRKAILRWKHCTQHIMDLNVSPCCRTCQHPVLSLHWAPCGEAEMSPELFCKFFLTDRLLIPRGEVYFCMTFQLCYCLTWILHLAQGHVSSRDLQWMKYCFAICFASLLQSNRNM